MKKSYIKTILACSFVISLAACTDTWDEHYQPNPDLNGSDNLWQLISSDSDLADFAALLRATGYDSILTQNRNYTVWAPADISEAFDISSLADADESMLAIYRKEIVENHIADYSHVAGGVRDKNDKKKYKKVKVLNGKSYDFEGSVGSVYTFASQKLSSSNKAASNGVLHKMEKCVLFASNIWEQLAKEPAVSDLYKFLVKDYDTIFNENASVKGPIVDGKQTYLDSVFDYKCRWFNEIGQINKEDSSYTMYALTNSAWNEMYDMVRGYYNYPNVSTKDEVAGGMPLNEAADSLVKDMLVRNLVFSNSVNKKFYEGQRDTLISTTWKMFVDEDAHALNNGCEKSVTMSNGTLNIVNQVNYNPFTCWLDTIRVQGESLSSANNFDRGEGTDARFANATVTSYGYVHGEPLYNKLSGNKVGIFTPTDYKSEGSQPVLRFYVEGLMSAYYRISIVLLPPHLVDPEDNVFVKPNKFKAKLETNDGKNGYANKLLASGVVSDPTKVDTIVLADCYKIGYCEANYEKLSGLKPKARLVIETDIKFGSEGRNTDNITTYSLKDENGKKITVEVKPEERPKYWKYDNSYRIDQVIFEPVEAPAGE